MDHRPAVPRVELHPPRATDEAAFVAAVRASRDLHHPWSAPPDTPEAFRRWLDRAGGERHAPRLVRLARDPRVIVGTVNLSEIVRGPLQGCFIGWNGMAGHVGRGLMTEAVRLALDLAFRAGTEGGLGLHRVEANIQPGNDASRRLASRVGFRLEGFSPRYLRVAGAWRDHERWAVLADEPRPPGPVGPARSGHPVPASVDEPADRSARRDPAAS